MGEYLDDNRHIHTDETFFMEVGSKEFSVEHKLADVWQLDDGAVVTTSTLTVSLGEVFRTPLIEKDFVPSHEIKDDQIYISPKFFKAFIEVLVEEDGYELIVNQDNKPEALSFDLVTKTFGFIIEDLIADYG